MHISWFSYGCFVGLFAEVNGRNWEKFDHRNRILTSHISDKPNPSLPLSLALSFTEMMEHEGPLDF